MGRVYFRVVSVAGLALLLMSMGASRPVLAQESAKQEKPAAHGTPSQDRTYTWRKKAEGVWEAHVSRFPDDTNEKNKPEFAVLRLSADRYQEFLKDRLAFLNKYKIFSAEVKKQSLFTEPPPQAEDPPPEQYYVVVPHWPASTAAATTYAGGSEPK